MNATHRPLVIMQSDPQAKAKKQFCLEEKGELTYYFERDRPTRWIKIRELAPEEDSLKLHDRENIEDDNWSSMFNVEDIEDFQIAFKSYPLQHDIEEMERAMLLEEERQKEEEEKQVRS